MTAGTFRFDRFILKPEDRQLKHDDSPVDLNGRYFDALTLLVREEGRLVSKDRFLEEVWRGIPVTDEALTQCIRTLRRKLGDDAARPRFIETVPKHGYRFIAPVDILDGEVAGPERQASRSDIVRFGIAGTVGGGVAGATGGLLYGFVAASNPLQPETGAASALFVLVCVCTLIASLGGAGVSFGMAFAKSALGRTSLGVVAGGALGGLTIGAVVKLLGLDAFSLLLGRSPGDITGPFEGVLVGGAVGLGAWLASRASTRRRGVALAALSGGVGGAVVPLLGGRLMAGSLDLLAQAYPTSRLNLDRIGAVVGEVGVGPLSQVMSGALEGSLFAACIVWALAAVSNSRSPKLATRPPLP